MRERGVRYNDGAREFDVEAAAGGIGERRIQTAGSALGLASWKSPRRPRSVWHRLAGGGSGVAGSRILSDAPCRNSRLARQAFSGSARARAAGRQILGVQPGTSFQLRQELFENADDFAGWLERLFDGHDGIHKSSSACSSRRS